MAISSRPRPFTLHTFRLEETPRHLDETEAPPFPGGVGQLEAAGLEAMQKCGFNRRAPGFHLILPAHADMGPGLDCGITCRCRINQGGTRLADHDAALDQIIGQCLVDIQLAGGIIDAGHAGTFIGENPLRLHVGLAVAAPLLAGRRLSSGAAPAARHLGTVPQWRSVVLRRSDFSLRLCRSFNSRISHWGFLFMSGISGFALPQQATGCWRGVGAEARGTISANRNGGKLERLPVDGRPDRNSALFFADFVGPDACSPPRHCG